MDSRQEHLSHLPLRERWLMAGIAGNSMWPQYGTLITLAEASELFQSEPGEIVELTTNGFSKDEVKKAEAVMTAQHIKHGVSKEVNDTLIIRESMEKLMRTEREVSVRFLLAFLLRLKSPDQIPATPEKPSVCAHELEIFLRNDENREVVTLGKKLFKIASQVLRSSKEFSEEHTQWIKEEYPLMSESRRRGESPLSFSDQISIGSSKGHNKVQKAIIDAWVTEVGDAYTRKFLEERIEIG